MVSFSVDSSRSGWISGS